MIPIITIDGPSGSGKGTLSHKLASHLKWHVLDSGSIYRLCALACIDQRVDITDEVAVEALACQLAIDFKVTESGVAIYLAGKKVNSLLRTENVGMVASKIAAFGTVRAAVLAAQRQFAAPPGLVADGRDMGTVVFSEAQLKFFLTASAQKRAERRYKQLQLQGHSGNLATILADIEQRDERDRNRSVAPLVPAEGAIIIDSSEIDINQVFKLMLTHVHKVFPVNTRHSHTSH